MTNTQQRTAYQYAKESRAGVDAQRRTGIAIRGSRYGDLTGNNPSMTCFKSLSLLTFFTFLQYTGRSIAAPHLRPSRSVFARSRKR